MNKSQPIMLFPTRFSEAARLTYAANQSDSRHLLGPATVFARRRAR